MANEIRGGATRRSREEDRKPEESTAGEAASSSTPESMPAESTAAAPEAGATPASSPPTETAAESSSDDGYVVAPGKSITTLIGMVHGGEPITERLLGSRESLLNLAEKGHIVPAPKKKG